MLVLKFLFFLVIFVTKVNVFFKTSQGALGERKAEGKFAELPGAEDGKVVVRFPPEASG